MQKNNNNGQKRPVLVEKNPIKPQVKNQARRTPQNKQTVGQRQMMMESSHQAMSMANRRGPSLQERAEQHRREMVQEANGQRTAKMQQPKAQGVKNVPPKPKKRKQKSQKSSLPKEPGMLDKLFVRGNAVAGAPDFFIMEVVAVLLAIGLIMVFSASSYRSLLENGNAYSYFIKQTASAVMGIIVAFMVMMLKPKFFQKVGPVLLIFVFFLLLFTLFAGEESLGATRWVTIAGIRFQPSEMAKPLMVI